MENILREPLEKYLVEKTKNFTANQLAHKFRHDFPNLISELILDRGRYKVKGSTGQGGWSDCPWIAILDILITDSPQSGYYPVLLFKADMAGVYLSLNQGVTEVREGYKRNTKDVLKLRAKDFRAKIDYSPKDNYQEDIQLNSNNRDAKLYEAGNIIAKYYSIENLPDSETFKGDILSFLRVYDDLTFNDQQIPFEANLTAIERKQYRLHFRIERNSSISKRVKKHKGYKCEACKFDFRDKYGELGDKFIEAHHITPISSLEIGTFKINVKEDFLVLCSNCHSMIHRLPSSGSLATLKNLIRVK
jgi:5-methylcytosine-specific restriction protein A